MATTKRKSDSRNAVLDYSVYVPLGAGQLMVEKARGLFGRTWTIARSPRTAAVQAYQGLSQRGEKIARSIRRSAYTKAAFEQARSARSQVKAATTGVRKTAGSSATAARAAAKKVG
jgi:hypothetical protein